MHKVRLIFCFIGSFFCLSAVAGSIAIIHLKPANTDESHEVYILPLFPSQSGLGNPSRIGVLATHWNQAELNLLNIPHVTLENDIYILPWHPIRKEYELAGIDKNPAYSVTSRLINQPKAEDLNHLFLGEIPVPQKTEDQYHSYQYKNCHGLGVQGYSLLVKLIEKTLEEITGHHFKKRASPIITSKVVEDTDTFVLEGTSPTPNEESASLQVYRCGLIYLEVPAAAFTAEPSQPPPAPLPCQTFKKLAPLPQTLHERSRAIQIRQNTINSVVTTTNRVIHPIHSDTKVLLQKVLEMEEDVKRASAPQESAQSTKPLQCACKASLCNKNYCVCFQAKKLCSELCQCSTGCKNEDHNDFSSAKPFTDKFQITNGKIVTHKSGCKCRKMCEKKYCACRAAGVICNKKCHSGTICTNREEKALSAIQQVKYIYYSVGALKSLVRTHGVKQD